MMEFFNNCYQWFINNYENVTIVIGSAQFASLLSGLILLVKSIKGTKENVTSSKALNETLGKTNEMSSGIDSLKSEIKLLRTENKKLKEDQQKTIDSLDNITTQLKAIIEVQSIVYSTIKDDNIRNAVNSLLVNAKYSETLSRAKLQKEVEELRDKVSEKVKEVTNDVDKAVNVVKGIVSNDEQKDDVIRY